MTLINKPNYIPLINTLGINSVISPAQITVSSILSKIRSGSIKSIHSIIEDKGEVLEARALESSKIVGRSLKELKLPKSICIGAIFRKEELIIPRGETIIEVDDTIIIFLSDNGPNGNRWNNEFKERKGSTNEGGVRVPFFIQWPKKIKPGIKIKQVTSVLDVFPSLIDLIENTTNINFDGKSFPI